MPFYRVTLEVSDVFWGEDERDAVDFAKKTRLKKTLLATAQWDEPCVAKAERLTKESATPAELARLPWQAWTGPDCDRPLREQLGE